MSKRRILAFALATVVFGAGMTASAQGTVLYDEEGGIVLQELLREDGEAWPAMAAGAEMSIQAKGAVLMDQASGTVLFEKDSRAHLPIASVTKVMTLLLVMEAIEGGRLSFEETVSCSERAASMGGSQIWLEPGEVMTVRELVKAAAVVSANDACAALAEHLSGSIEGFVAAMNERAAQLGMADTHFVDCSGLDDRGYSCAYDVAVMSRQLMTHPEIQGFTTIWMDTLRNGKSQLVNTNKLVRHYRGATGLKTGTTQASGHCLAATAQRDGTAFVAVVLGCATTAERFDGARALLDYGFSAYVSYTPPEEALKTTEIPVFHGQRERVATTVEAPRAVLLKKGSEKQAGFVVELAENLEAPVELGQIVGSWRLTVGEETVAEYPVRAAAGVPRVDFRFAYCLLMEALLR